MSLNTYVVLSILLCLSSHACSARHLGVHIFSKKHEKENNVVKNSVLLNAQVPPLWKKLEVATKDQRMVKEDYEDDHGNNKDKQMEPHGVAKEKMKRLTRKRSYNDDHVEGSDRSDLVVSIPWRIPHTKRGEHHPAFNLDYAPPKTHPPVHN